MRRVYTDGSASKNLLGYAFYAEADGEHEEQIESGSEQGNDAYRAELLAIVMAMEKCEGRLSIINDHRGILSVLNNMMHGGYDRPVKSADLWKRAEENILKVGEIRWMKRCSTYQQKVVDELAGNESRGASR